jgi:hypothetical protein
VVKADDLALAREIVVELDFRCDHVRIFELHLPAEPQLRNDDGEIVAARHEYCWRKSIPPFVRA